MQIDKNAIKIPTETTPSFIFSLKEYFPLTYINSYAQTKKDDLENQIKVSKLAEENLDTFIKKFYLIKKESKLFDKYEIFKTNISLLFFEKVKRN